MRAGGKALGRVGKSDLIHRFRPVGAGRAIVMRARIFAPQGAALDGEVVLDARGETLLNQGRVSKLAAIKVAGAVDRFQFGITSNSNPRAAALLVDDVSFSIR